MNPRTAKPLLLAGLALAVFVFPWAVQSSYWLNLVNLAISFSVACLGLNIVLGYTGQLSLGHAAFFALGAYASAVLNMRLGISPWLGMFVGALLAVDSATTALIVMVPIAAAGWLIMTVNLVRGAIIASRGDAYSMPAWICSPLIK